MQAAPASSVLFVGTGRRLDTATLERHGFEYRTIRCQGLKGKSLVARLGALLQLPLALWEAFKAVRRFRPDLAFGVGGYVTGPVILAARLLAVPCCIHEQNIVPGLANRMLGRLVQRVFVSLPGSEAWFPAGRTVLSGNPVRNELLDAARRPREGNKLKGPTLLVLGGSQGAHRVNALMVEALAATAKQLPPGFNIIHQTGEQDAAMVRQAYERQGITALVQPFFHDMERLYSLADLVVSRAGATTLAELTLLGRPAILIPYPYAADNHQEKNGRLLVEQGGAIMFTEQGLDGTRLGREIGELLNNPPRLRAMAKASGTLARPEAREILVQECLAMVEAAKSGKKKQ